VVDRNKKRQGSGGLAGFGVIADMIYFASFLVAVKIILLGVFGSLVPHTSRVRLLRTKYQRLDFFFVVEECPAAARTYRLGLTDQGDRGFE